MKGTQSPDDQSASARSFYALDNVASFLLLLMYSDDWFVPFCLKKPLLSELLMQASS